MDDDIDVFAELGVDVTAAPQQEEDDDLLGLLADASPQGQEDPLATLVESDEADAFTVQPEVAVAPPVADAPHATASDSHGHALSEEMVAQVVALLVQRGLAVDPRRLGLPMDTGLEVMDVAVERDDDLLIARADVMLDGAAMHPFAAVRLTDAGCETLPAPEALPATWHPMHDVLAAALMDGAQQLDQALGGAWKRA